MDLPTIVMDKDAAKAKARIIREMPDSRRTEDDEATARGYEALARGLVLIDLATVMRDAGLDAEGLPRLAIGRADAKSVKFEAQRSTGGGEFYELARNGMRHAKRTTTLPPRTWNFAASNQGTCYWRRIAYAPSIPPEHRPAPSRLADHHVLWEAVWEPTPPVDPFLLKHLAGTLYVVLAQWDLTELEQAVLRGRIVADVKS